MKKKAVVFDLDGTLLYTVRSILHHLNKTFHAHGLAGLDSVDDILPSLGMGSGHLVEGSLEKMGARDLDKGEQKKILDEYNASYLSDPIPLTEKYPGIDQLVEDLRDQGFLLGVNSNKPDPIVKRIIKHFFPSDPFSQVLGRREDLPKKPDPASLNRMMENWGVDREDLVYIGDSEVDAEFSEGAQVDYILVTYGFRTKEALAKFNPIAFCDDCPEIYQCLMDF